MKKVKVITFGALMSALSIVILSLGSFFDVLDFTVVVVASVILAFCYEELKYKSIFIYIITSLLAIILLPGSILIALEYIFLGVYPVLKPVIDKTLKVLRIIIKAVYFILTSAGLVLISRFILMSGDVWYMEALLFLGIVLVMIMYDILLHRMVMYYRFVLRHRLRIDKFFH